MYVIIFISCLCRVNVILCICYGNLWWCVCKEYGKYTKLRYTSNNHEIMANLWLNFGYINMWWGFLEMDIKVQCGKMILTVRWVWWGYSWRSVEVFSDRGGISMTDGDGGDRLCVWVEMQK